MTQRQSQESVSRFAGGAQHGLPGQFERPGDPPTAFPVDKPDPANLPSTGKAVETPVVETPGTRNTRHPTRPAEPAHNPSNHMATDPTFTPRELDVMSILWRTGSGTVAEVKAELGEDLAYTSVLSVLQTLEEKGHVRHDAEGRAYRYHPTVDPEQAGGSALRRIRDAIFDGSAAQMFAQLVSDRRLSREELERMRRLLAERLEEER